MYNKKFFFLLIICSVIFSCSKDELISEESQSLVDDISYNNVKQKITDFNDLIKGRDTKSLFTVDETIWSLEADCNYTHRVTGEYTDIQTDTIIITLNKKEGNKIGITQVRKGIESINSQLSNLLNQERFLIFTDVNLKNEDKQKVDLFIIANTGYKVTNTKVLVTRESASRAILSSFGNTSWFWGLGKGKCGSNTGGLSLDAGKVISGSILIYLNQNEILTNINSVYVNPFDPYIVNTHVPNSFGYSSSLLFDDGGTWNINHACLDPTALSFYRNNLLTIGNEFKPTGQVAIDYDLESLIAVNTMQNLTTWRIAHRAKITYANITSPLTVAF